ncbi:MAG TPA: glycosyltransferase family 39 protein [Patescibacteria group bacterium]|nr:glycosyltransferase family 39 protein [Patescibacteria group bacterium]
MFLFAFVLGGYSYLIFFLGISGFLYKEIVVAFTMLFVVGVIYFLRKSLLQLLHNLLTTKVSKLFLFFVFLFVVQAGVNLIGALGPELAFDALWYHLTLPKLWLLTHTIEFIPGGLLYYSVMPKLGETLFVAGLSFGNEITVKMIHWSFGLLTCLALYKLSRKFFTPFISLVAVVIFYSNLVVAWESITAYIDLIRAFFEVLALWAFVNWWEKKERKWLILSAFMIGFAIATKLVAIGSLVVFLVLILWIRRLRGIKEGILFGLISLAVPLPWFIFSYITTGNPVYPFFTPTFSGVEEKLVTTDLLHPFHFFSVSWNTFLHAADPISPIYLIFLPLLKLFYKKLKNLHSVFLYSVGVYGCFYLTSGVEGTRMLLPYLPAFSLLCAGGYAYIHKNLKKVYLARMLLIVILLVSVISISYRFGANSKYLPVIFGQQTKDAFLADNLNFSFGDFYDTDGYFAKTIEKMDRVLLYGFHNLYYINFPFIDSSWVQPGDYFNYIATQNAELPFDYQEWQLVYENQQTMVKLYKQPERLYSLQ